MSDVCTSGSLRYESPKGIVSPIDGKPFRHEPCDELLYLIGHTDHGFPVHVCKTCDLADSMPALCATCAQPNWREA